MARESDRCFAPFAGCRLLVCQFILSSRAMHLCAAGFPLLYGPRLFERRACGVMPFIAQTFRTRHGFHKKTDKNGSTTIKGTQT
jgi:hypothetical protein